jgi:flagellar motor switch protein FliG
MMPLNACSNSICRPSGSAGFLTALEEENRDAAERIKALMLTFDDLVKLDAGSAQTLMRDIGKDKLAVALKGANETVRQFLFTNMSSRAAKMLVEDMQAMGPVRLRDVDEAQRCLSTLPRISRPRAKSSSPRAAVKTN